MAEALKSDTVEVQYRVTGMDCSSCAAKIETAARKLEGVSDVRVSIASQVMTLAVDRPEARLPEVEKTVAGLGNPPLIQCDATDEAQVKAVYEKLKADWG